MDPMVANKIKLATMIVLMAVTCAVQAVADRKPVNEKEPAEKVDPMFPDGVMHDFGKVKRGTVVKCTFRIVNTSRVPMRILSVRASMFPGRAWSTKDELQPSEEATIVIVYRADFVGTTTRTIFVLTESGAIRESRFWVRTTTDDAPPGTK
jgi:Protein of unknown function (DUF1573)